MKKILSIVFLTLIALGATGCKKTRAGQTLVMDETVHVKATVIK